MTLNLDILKQAKNTVIGNPSAKVSLARDGVFIRTLIECLNYPQNHTGDAHNKTWIRIEAAHVLSSLSYGSEEALSALLHSHAPRAFLYAISKFQPSDPQALRSAFARGLRALTASIADVVGPSQWGLRPEKSTIRNEARMALDYFFQNDSLDIYLPLLNLSTTTNQPMHPPQTSISTSIAQLLGAAIRSPVHRKAVSEWLPPLERVKEAKVRQSRGWEKTSAVGREAARGGGWVARGLTGLLRSKDVKLQEAALSALAALAKENPIVAGALAKSFLDRETPSTLSIVLSMSKSRSTDVQLAACLCATHIFRAASSSTPSLSSLTSPTGHTGPSNHPHSHADDSCVRTVMNIVNRMLSEPSESPSGTGLVSKTRACFVLYYLVSDDPELCQAAYERGCLESLVRVVHEITPAWGARAEVDEGMGTGGFWISTSINSAGGIGTSTNPNSRSNAKELDYWEWEGEEEPESISCLREGALTAIAAISLFDNDIRRFLTSPTSFTLPLPSSNPSNIGSTTTPPNTTHATTPTPTPLLLPLIHAALHHQHTGTRYAACQCVRALSRGVAVLRTNIVDSGLGMRVFGVFCRGVGLEGEKEGEGEEDGGGEEVEVEVEVEVEDRRVLGAALAAICNIVNEFSPLRPVFLEKGLMKRLVRVMRMDDPALRVSALWAVKNLLRRTSSETKRDVMRCLGWERISVLLTDTVEGVQEQALNVVRNLAENEDGIEMVFREIGPAVLMRHIESAFHSPEEDVVLQAAYLLANLSNGTSTHKSHILDSRGVLSSLQTCLAGTKTEIRKPVVGCVFELAQSDVEGRRLMVEAGLVGPLRRICEFGGGAGTGVGGAGAGAGAGAGHGGVRGVLEDDRDVVEQARMALDLLEQGEVPSL